MHETGTISIKVGRVAPRAPLLIIAALFTASTAFCAEATNSAAAPLTLPPLPAAGPSVLRVLGALALVIGIFLGGAWLYRNWQRLTIQRGRAPKLNVIETRPLGGKHAIYVIGYEQERFLLASSPNGVNLLTHLPAAEAIDEKDKPAEITAIATPSFAQALTKVLKGK
ncbi:MAG TPA: flagellar biosynthetic protein FliO [Candidatus Angelobacter sp.]|nr:flagellar biosynthetic protein FliO [Candidatus Angelobacter sp.]